MYLKNGVVHQAYVLHVNARTGISALRGQRAAPEEQ